MVLMRPFVPQSNENSETQQLTAFMAKRMDGDNYGKLVVYQMPSGNLPPGPGIAAANIRGDAQVSEQDTQLGLGSSQVLYGNLLLIPIDNALVYVQPFYVVSENEARRLPQLTKVIATFGDQVVIEDTLTEALAALFGRRSPPARSRPPRASPHGRRTTPGDGHGSRAGPGAPAGGGDPVLRGRRGAGLRRLRHVRGQDRPGPGQRRAGQRPPVGRGARLHAAGGGTTSTTAPPARPPPPPRPPRCRGEHHSRGVRRPELAMSPPRAMLSLPNDGVEQSAARRAHNPKVAGSNPAPATKASAGQARSPVTGSSCVK